MYERDEGCMLSLKRKERLNRAVKEAPTKKDTVVYFLQVADGNVVSHAKAIHGASVQRVVPWVQVLG